MSSLKEKQFVRELEVCSQTLTLYQKLEGDVSCVVWDASIVLAKYLEEFHRKHINYFKDLNVIELGAGVGCVGLTATCLGANVLLTDLSEALPLLEFNIAANKAIFKGTASAACLLWGQKFDLNFSPNVILLADCIYYKESIDPLIKTLVELAGSETEIFLSQELRQSEKQEHHWQYFVTSAKKYFNFYVIPLEEQNNEYSSTDIMLIKLTKL